MLLHQPLPFLGENSSSNPTLNVRILQDNIKVYSSSSTKNIIDHANSTKNNCFEINPNVNENSFPEYYKPLFRQEENAHNYSVILSPLDDFCKKMKNLTRHHILLSDETLSNDVSTNPLKQNNEDNNTTFSNRNSSPALFTSIDMPLNKKKH